MELLTDILAIAGWASLGALIPGLGYMFRSHQEDKLNDAVIITWGISFGLIAASLVLS